MNQRFTIDGSPELESALEAICERAREKILEAVPSALVEAILLGGGYGRGEGGVLATPEGERPYNDIEFYLCLRGSTLVNERRFLPAVHKIEMALAQAAGVEVEFKIFSLDKLRREPVSMFCYDLISGHRRVHGEEGCLAECGHHRAAHRIPLHEATRLLMNRCSGLLFTAERLERPAFGPEEADFAGRNLAKAKLALGDVILAARGQYHWSCLERHKRLSKSEASVAVPRLEEIISLHEQGVEFKLRPIRTAKSAAELRPEFEFIRDTARDLWLWLEKRRLGRSWRTARDYALDDGNKCPERNPWKNRLINARTFGKSGIASSRYPRERLLNSLALLLWEPETLRAPELRQYVCQQLKASTAADFSGLAAAYERIWKIYN